MKEYSMRSHNRRNHQRWLNRYCRAINKGIANDPLWLGRFVVEQKATEMEWFDDGSGGILHCHLQFRDKKTGITEDWHTDCLDITWRMFFKMNNFIIETCKVWEREHPYQERKDYRNAK